MNKAKLEIVKINEDVITTSCSDAVLFLKYPDVFYIKTGINFSTDVVPKMTEYYGSSSGALSAYYAAAADTTNAYHILSNGKIEICNNPDSHKGTGWNEQ